MRRIVLLCLCALFPLGAQASQYTVGGIPLALNGALEGRAIYALDRDTPTEHPSAKLTLNAKAEFGKWGAGKLTLEAIQDGKVHDPDDGHLFYELDTVYQDKNPALNVDEAYLDLFTGKADFRIGIQKFAWGRLDEINPTDNLNTEDTTDPILNDENERKIGVPAVKANIYSDIVNCEIAWIPRYVPYRLAQPGERWFPPMLQVPDAIETNTAIGSIPVEAVYEDIDLPPLTVANSEAGIRLMKSVDDWEFSASYFTGYDPLPVAGIPTDLIVEVDNPLSLKPDIRALVHVEPRLHRMHVFGLDLSTTYAGFTIRGEGAFYHGKYYFRTFESILPEVVTPDERDRLMDEFLQKLLASGQTRQTFRFNPPIEVKSDALKYGLGIDYVRGETTLTMQCIQEHVLDFDADKPVYFIKHGWDTTLIMAYKQFFLQNTLEMTVGGAYDIQFKHYLFQPSLTYSFTDALKGIMGAVFIQGKDDESLLGQFRRNDELFGKLKYSF